MKSSTNTKVNKKQKISKKHVKNASRIFFWFSIGAIITLFLVASFSYIAFQGYYSSKIYPGITINGVDFSRKTEAQVKAYFDQKNLEASDSTFVFNFEDKSATVSAKDIDFGYDSNLLTTQAMSIGRSKDPLSNIDLIISSYINGTDLSPAYTYSQRKLENILDPLYKQVDKKPVEAVFNFEDGKVTQFIPSENGRQVDKEELNQQIVAKGKLVLNFTNQKIIIIPIPVKTLKPNLTTDKVNNMGIRELIGSGTSLFQHSIESRVFNVNLGASRVNGILVPPNEIFSFDKTVGDVSSLTGYKQAYVIENGKTVLGDGGGICQVSTTLFRAVLNAGLPIVERHAHAYRVGYYEEDSSPGIDATVYVPSVDFKFKNDTGHYILIQSVVDPSTLRLTFMIYGTNDGRVSDISTPVITNQTPAPPDKYEDDPTLPAGTVKQVDFAAAGANVYFTRTVTKNGKVIIADKFTSDYRPWQAVYLRGTKQ
jgi:vancomycin resistance protein YoaR